MELNSKTRENIKDVVFGYKTDKMDVDFYKKILSLINQDDAFYGKIICEFLNKSREWSYVDMLTRIMYINPTNMIKYVTEITKNYECELTKEEFFELKKMFYLFSIFHETAHVEQGLMMYEDYSKYEELNRMYRNIFTKLNGRGSLFAKIMYHFFAETFSYERSANINSYRELFDIYEDSSIKPYIVSNYICELLNGYKEKKNGIISPVEDTMKKIGIVYDINHESIPFNERIESGLPVEACEYNKIFEFVEGKNLGDVDFKALRNTMK